MERKRKRVLGTVLFYALLVPLIGMGVFLVWPFPALFRAKLREKMTIQEGTPAYESWKKSSLPLTLRLLPPRSEKAMISDQRKVVLQIGIRSRFLGRFGSDLTRSFSIVKSEVGPN